jgi:protein-S-isoprenylcysteine O-methyltransferase Ste14
MGRMVIGLVSRIPLWIGYLWLVWAVSWWLLAMWRKPVDRRGSGNYEVGHRVLLVAGAILFFRPWWLGLWAVRRFYVPRPPLLWAALAAVLAGFALCYWARFTLGGNWSGRIVLKQEHELIRRGPYARIRHPIYTGILLAVAGTLAATCYWGAAAGAALMFIAFYIKSHGEEKLLAPVFGERFAEHLRQTGRFLPKLRRPAAAGGSAVAD